jgi:uncharacterized protein YgbK (DUF1537 family)
MIAVIADDLTGAAELAGIGLYYQLKTEVNTIVEPDCKADLLIIATDTRSLPVAEAKRIVYKLTQQLKALNPQVIFKKIDSVLRGHILDEIGSQMEAAGSKRALIIPGNIQHGKKVIDGIYYFNNKPVHLSGYSVDPAFAVTSSNVRHMLRADDDLPLIKPHEKLPDTGIMICETADENALTHWVNLTDDNTIIAGASGLFNCLLNRLIPTKPILDTTNTTIYQISPSRLFVFGSTFHQGQHQISNGYINNIPVAYIPASIIAVKYPQDYLYEGYANQVVQTLTEHHNAIIAIHPDTTKGLNIDPILLTHKMGIIVKYINLKTHLHQLLIEGGATAWAILAQLNISKLYPLKQISPGVIRMKIAGNNQLYVTLKPGSYDWPASVWTTN